MNEYKYILDKSSKKFTCPNCHKKRLVRFIDVETDDYIEDHFGKCDREVNCAYYLSPYSTDYVKNDAEYKPAVKIKKRAYIPIEILKETRQAYEENTFIQNLLNNIAYPFEVTAVEKIISMYHLGTVKKGYRAGAITFPFIDKNNNIRAIQVKQFDNANHTTGTDFLHSIIEKHHITNKISIPKWLELYNGNDLKVSCLFGEHLLSKYAKNPIALVESPKTAIYGTLYFGEPKNDNDFIWLAVYNLSSLNVDKCKSLKNRNVVLFPDTSESGKAYQLWNEKARVLQDSIKGSIFTTSNLLENSATEDEKKNGCDLADFLIKQDWRLFKKQAHTLPSLSEEEQKQEANDWQELQTAVDDMKKKNETAEFKKWHDEYLENERRTKMSGYDYQMHQAKKIREEAQKRL